MSYVRSVVGDSGPGRYKTKVILDIYFLGFMVMTL